MKRVHRILLFVLLSGGTDHADGTEAYMEKWLDRLGIVKHHNEAATTRGGLTADFIGGSGEILAHVYDTNPIHVNMPGFSVGCGGIKYATGAFSLIKGKELREAGKTIIKSATFYAFDLGLHTLTPIVSATVSKIQSYANQLNAININSCQIGRSLLNAAWPRSEAASSYICEQAREGKYVTGLIERRHDCHANKDRVKERATGEVEDKSDVMISEYNLAWKIFNKIGKLQKEEMDLLVNFTGTVVRKGQEVRIYPPKKPKEVIHAILRGGKIKNAYAFAEPKGGGNYAEMKEEDRQIDVAKSWQMKVRKHLEAIRDKLTKPDKYGASDTLTEAESNLLRESELPIQTLLVLNSRRTAHGYVIPVSRIAMISAFQRLYTYLGPVLDGIRKEAYALQPSQISSSSTEELEELRHAINEAEEFLESEKVATMRSVKNIATLNKFLRESDALSRGWPR
ncbi:MAG: conjugal transfer protein TraH [Simkaniaceae bacterium]|nr:conjugal transfer protein TraH [Simkaniaceae bacterium]